MNQSKSICRSSKTTGSIALLLMAMIVLATSISGAADRSSHIVSDGREIEVEECVVRFAAEIEVPALETGRIDDVIVRRNDAVKSGSVIAVLDDQGLLIRRRSAQLRVTSAQSTAKDDVEIKYAEIALAEAEAELENSRSIQNDVRGAIPITQIRRLRLAVQRGELEVAQAKNRKQRAEVESQLLKAKLSAIDDQIENLRIESPVDGVVLDVAHDAGEWIEKGRPIAIVGRLSQLHVHALVSSEQVSPRHCKNLPVSVHWLDPSDGTRRSLSGHVLSVDPQTLPGGRYRLHAEINNERTDGAGESWSLTPGTTIRMKVYISADVAKSRSFGGQTNR